MARKRLTNKLWNVSLRDVNDEEFAQLNIQVRLQLRLNVKPILKCTTKPQRWNQFSTEWSKETKRQSHLLGPMCWVPPPHHGVPLEPNPAIGEKKTIFKFSLFLRRHALSTTFDIFCSQVSSGQLFVKTGQHGIYIFSKSPHNPIDIKSTWKRIFTWKTLRNWLFPNQTRHTLRERGGGANVNLDGRLRSVLTM